MVKTILKIKKSNTFKNESGRSMVEMLGVLAIIGVLSIGGIMGYRYAMDKHAANVFVNDLWVEAVHVSPQAIKKNADLRLTSGSDTGETTSNYTMNVKYETTGNYDLFVLSVEKVPSKICEQVVSMGWNMPPENIYTGAAKGTTDCAGVNGLVTMNFVFDAELGEGEYTESEDDQPETCTTVADCSDVGCGMLCVSGECVDACSSTGKKCATDDSGSKTCCSSENVIGNFCCAMIQDGQCCDIDAYCCPKDKPLYSYVYDEDDGFWVERCLACDDERSIIGVSTGRGYGCSACPDRTERDGQCVKCPANTVYSWSDGCIPCNHEGYMDGVDGSECAQECPNRNSSEYGCPWCPEGKTYDSAHSKCYLCSSSQTYDSVSGTCYSCDEEIIAENLCSVCPGREVVAGRCMKKCPEGTPLRYQDNGTFGCRTCDQGFTSSSYYNCSTSCPGYEIKSGGTVCVPECKGETPLEDMWTGGCYSCDSPYQVDTTEAGCQPICPNRVFSGSPSSGACMLN